MEDLSKKIKVTYDNDSFYKYALGYYDCGLTLIDNLLNNNRYEELSKLNEDFRKENIKLEEECNIYPVLFLFRQYFELMLKALYLEFEIAESKEIFHNHKISDLWPPLKNKLLELEKDSDQLEGITENLDEIANKFSIIDDESYCFRYPVNTKGIPYFKDDRTYDLYEIKQDMIEFNSLIHEFL